MTAGIAIPSSTGEHKTSPRVRRTTIQQVLLICGIASSLLYAAMLVFVPLFWKGYSSASQTVSELSAIDAPSRSLWRRWAAFGPRSMPPSAWASGGRRDRPAPCEWSEP
jgi:hypothetical protein